MKKRRLPYKKMIEEIDKLVNNDWGADMVDYHIDLHKSTSEKIYYKNFTQKEAQEMSEVLGKIYMIAHCVHCVCYPKLTE